MHRLLLAIALSLTLVLTLVAVPAFAGPPPPKKTTADCSPGYYKNHVGTWCGGACPATGFTITECDALLDALEAQGPGSGAIRAAASGFLNDCFGTAEASPARTTNPSVEAGVGRL
jgi:hypothetical protein